MVCVHRNDEAQLLEALVALSLQDEAAVDSLRRRAELDASVDAQRRRQRSIAQVPRRVARVLRGLCERERAGGTNDPLEPQGFRAGAISALTPRSYARRRMGSASSSRPCSRRKFAHSIAASPASARRGGTPGKKTARRG